MEKQDILSEGECWNLLATATVGRVALSMHALPAILPVQYCLHEDAVEICLGHYEVPPQSAHEAIVAFCVDDIDSVTRSGWSVQILGKSVFPHDFGMRTDCGEPTGGQILHLKPSSITGYRIQLCPFVSAFGLSTA